MIFWAILMGYRFGFAVLELRSKLELLTEKSPSRQGITAVVLCEVTIVECPVSATRFNLCLMTE